MALFKDLYHGMAHLLFPRLCSGCAQPLMPPEDVLCLACLQELPDSGYHLVPDNEAAIRLAGRIPYEQVTALSAFTPGGLLQHLLHLLKYHDKQEIGLFLGRQLGYRLAKSAWGPAIDLLVPVPLHPKKEAKRGYNQSRLIALGLGQVLRKPVAASGAVKRTRATESQTTKTREERIANVRNAFEVRDPALLARRHVLLIDDVLTTGATLEAVALALLQVPGLTVSIATIGIAAG